MSQQEKQINANSNNNSNIMDAEIFEQGDIYFFYRPKKAAEEVKGIEDVRRFFMVLHLNKKKKIKRMVNYTDFLS